MHFATWTLLLAMTIGEPDRAAPLAWSPDGKWLAYVQEARSIPSPLHPGWLFEVGPNETAEIGRRGRLISYKLWATRPASGESVLLEASDGPLSAPAWSRDGSSIAFGRIRRGTDGGLVWEGIARDGAGRRRVLHRESLEGPPAQSPGIGLLVPSWSPDGRMIAFPRLQPPGVVIVRAEGGGVVRALDAATKPEWSPKDNRLAYFSLADHPCVMILDGILATPRSIASVSDIAALPAPIWGRDGQTILTLRRAAANSTAGGVNRGAILQLCRYRPDGTQIDAPVDLTHDPIGPPGALTSVSFAVGPDGADAFYTTTSSGQSGTAVTWSTGKFDVVRQRFKPLDEGSIVGSLACSPAEHALALRIGADGGWSPPGVYNPNDESLLPLIPDPSARAEWLTTAIDLASTALRDRLPTPTLADGTPCERPSLLPAPGELDPGDPLALRLKRLAKLGLTVLGPVSPETDEARLAFAYLAGDGLLASEVTERLLARATTPDARLRLRAIQAQILLMRRDFERAKPLIAYLQAASTGPTHEVSDDLQGRGLTKLASPPASWPAFLAERSDILRKPPIEAGHDLVPPSTLDLNGLRGMMQMGQPALGP